METRTYKVYEWDELSAKAKDRARQQAQEHNGYPWSREALKSLESLAAHFGGKLSDYSVDWFNSSYSTARFTMPDGWTEADIRAALGKLGKYNRKTLKGLGECQLTGYASDEDAIDGLRRAFLKDKERDLTRLMEAAFRSWLKAAQENCAGIYSDEGMKDSAEANGYRYTEAGDLD